MGALEIGHSLAASRRAVRLYPPEHPSHREAVRALTAVVNEAVDVRPLSLNLHKGRLYEGSEVINDPTPAARAIAEAMEVRRIESLTFHVGFAEVDAEGVSEVLSLRPMPDLDIQAELEARGVRAVTAAALEDESADEAEERDRRREADRALFRRAAAALRDLESALAEGGEINPDDVRRALAPLVVRTSEEPAALVALATMAGHGDRSLSHGVRVTLLALVIGGALDMSDQELLALASAALLHDAGMPVAVTRGLDAEAVRDAHPLLGAERLGCVSDEDCGVIIVAYQHHMGVDGSGWPQRREGEELHPYSRIVAVADRYDDLVRPADGEPLRPDDAVAQLLREASGGPLDPIIARLLAGLVGVFPVGSVLRLSDHSVGVVSEPGEDPLRPRIRLVLGPDGVELRPATDIDLTEDGRAVVEALEAGLTGVQPSEYI